MKEVSTKRPLHDQSNMSSKKYYNFLSFEFRLNETTYHFEEHE